MKSVILSICLATVFLNFAKITSAQQPVASGLNNLLNAYFDVKDALVNSQAAQAAIHSAGLLRAIGAVEPDSLSASGRNAFLKLKDKLEFDARYISESKDIEHQRGHFAVLSANLAALAKKVTLSTEPIYKDYCPMKKAYWLSRDKTINNPYFGKAMPTCGTIEETLQ